MTLTQIREKLSISIAEDTQWINKLDDTEPGHYGVEDWNVYLEQENIWVDIPTRSFKFKEAKFGFEVILGSSNDGIQIESSKIANGQGTFTFSDDGKEIIIKELNIEVDLDLMV